MSVPVNHPLVVVPCDEAPSLDVAARCLVGLAATAAGAEVLVVGHPGADPVVSAQLQAAASELGFLFGLPDTDEPRIATVNAALERARDSGRDAVLLAPDVELQREGWLELLAGREDTAHRAAAMVGGRLLHPNGFIEHAGMQFSLLQSEFVSRFRLGPATLVESRVPALRPVGPGIVFLRHAAMAELGLLDPELPGVEIVDYALRCFAAGLECIYEPAVVGTCYRDPYAGLSPTEREKQERHVIARRLNAKHAGALARWIAPVKGEPVAA